MTEGTLSIPNINKPQTEEHGSNASEPSFSTGSGLIDVISNQHLPVEATRGRGI